MIHNLSHIQEEVNKFEAVQKAFDDIRSSVLDIQQERESHLEEISRWREHASDVSNCLMHANFAAHSVKSELEAVKKENEELKRLLRTQELTAQLQKDVASMKTQRKENILEKLKSAVAAGPIFGPIVNLNRLNKLEEVNRKVRFEELSRKLMTV